jgi:hypothetical protein
MVQNFARLWLETRDGSNRMFLAATLDGSYGLRVLPGLYDVLYEHANGDVLPSNPRALIDRNWNVAAQANRTIDIPSARYEGTFLLNGGAFPNSPYETGRISLVPAEGLGDPVVLGATRDGAFARPVIPGTYRSAYALLQGETTVPVNTFTTFGPSRRVRPGGASESVILDVPAAPLTVSYAHNGVPLPTGGPANARLHLYRDGNTLVLPESAEGPLERVTMPGRFDVFYSYLGGAGLPRNVFMPIACWNLVP